MPRTVCQLQANIRAFRAGVSVSNTWRMAAIFCIELETGFAYLERPEMRSHTDSPFLA